MEILIVGIIFGSIFGVFYLYFTTRNKERLALIEKGADASMFKIGREPVKKESFGSIFNVLKIGLFLIGAGLGVAVGFFMGTLGMAEGAAYPSMILMFAGLGLVIYYLITRKKID